MSEIKRKPSKEWDLLKARQITVEGEFAVMLVEQCIAVKQLRLAKVIADFAETMDKDIADALGFYSVEDFHKFMEDKETESD